MIQKLEQKKLYKRFENSRVVKIDDLWEKFNSGSGRLRDIEKFELNQETTQ